MNEQEATFVKALLDGGVISFKIAGDLESASDSGEGSVWDLAVTGGHLTADQARQFMAAAGIDTSALSVPPPEEAAAASKLGNFRLEGKLGQGAMGVVYKAYQESMDRYVALKVLPRSLASNQDFINRFLREARAAGQLGHPHVVRGIDAGFADGYYYFAMEYVEGRNLGDRLKAEGFLEEREAVEICRQVALALQHAHEAGIIHRDVKPENIMISVEGGAKLCDLGLARRSTAADSGLVGTGRAVGTPYYVAPEQVRGLEPDARADIYSLGATLYHMLAGRPPFQGPNPMAVMQMHLGAELKPPSEHRLEVSRAADAVALKMMARRPEERYATAAELAADLAKVVSGGVPSALTGAMADRRRAARLRRKEVSTAGTQRVGTRGRVARGTVTTRPVGRVGTGRSRAVDGDLDAGLSPAESGKRVPWKLVAFVVGLLVLAGALGGLLAASRTRNGNTNNNNNNDTTNIDPEKARLQRLRTVFEAIRVFERNNAGAYDELIAKYTKLLGEAEDTSLAEEVGEALKRVHDRKAAAKDVGRRFEYTKAARESSRALKRGEFLEAVGPLEAFAAKYPGTPEAGKAAARVGQIKGHAASLLAAARKQSDDALAAGRYGGAVGPLEDVLKAVKSAKGLEAVPARIREVRAEITRAYQRNLEPVLADARAGRYAAAAAKAGTLAAQFRGTAHQDEAAAVGEGVKALPRMRTGIIAAAKKLGERKVTFRTDAPLLGGVGWRVTSIDGKGVFFKGKQGDLELESLQPWKDLSARDIYNIYKLYLPKPTKDDHRLLADFCSLVGLKSEAAAHRRKSR